MAFINFLEFEECRKIISKFNLNSKMDWDVFSKTLRPKNIPASPNLRFKDQWISWNHWLSSKKVPNILKKKLIFYSFSDCKEIVSKFKFKTTYDFKKWINLKIDLKIPTNPDKTYKYEWVSWNDFLGTGNSSNKDINRNFLSFNDARNFVRGLKLKSQKEWYEYKAPNFIPSNPHRTYKTEWISLSDWLGIETIATQNRIYLSYEDAKKYIRGLNLKMSWSDILRYVNLPIDIPRTPSVVYKNKGWISHSDFIGYEQIKSKGELLITNYLENNSIKFELQKKFKNCINIKQLIFDFYLPDYNTCIEYDGKQHFEAIEWFGGENALLSSKIRDQIKTNFCIENNIKLIRISYKDDVLNKLFEELIYKV